MDIRASLGMNILILKFAYCHSTGIETCSQVSCCLAHTLYCVKILILGYSITSVLVRYQILDVEFETCQHAVKRDIVFDSTNVILTNYLSPIKFIQFLQTGQMVVEVQYTKITAVTLFNNKTKVYLFKLEFTYLTLYGKKHKLYKNYITVKMYIIRIYEKQSE